MKALDPCFGCLSLQQGTKYIARFQTGFGFLSAGLLLIFFVLEGIFGPGFSARKEIGLFFAGEVFYVIVSFVLLVGAAKKNIKLCFVCCCLCPFSYAIHNYILYSAFSFGIKEMTPAIVFTILSVIFHCYCLWVIITLTLQLTKEGVVAAAVTASPKGNNLPESSSMNGQQVGSFNQTVSVTPTNMNSDDAVPASTTPNFDNAPTDGV